MLTKKISKLALGLSLISMLTIGCSDDGSNESQECEKNACGSCGVLPHTPGDGCTNGIWTCDDNGGVVCKENQVTEDNPCGGKSKLDLYGKECGACGIYKCDGTDTLKCEDSGKNVCGGCGALEHNPGDTCDNGVWTCSDGDLICKEGKTLTEPNDCGGMMELTGEKGGDCGVCGKYECAGTDALICNDPGMNDCGGCNALEHKPGETCGECGKYVCETNESTKCDDPGKNDCGGCSPLTAVPDTPCGTSECAKWTCDGKENVVCGSKSMNACGGCTALDHKPGESCSGSQECCTWVCDDHGGIIKDEHAVNACGGCGILEYDPGTKCAGGHGVWACDKADTSKNRVTCTCDEHDECGGCNKEHKVGDSCSICESYHWGDLGDDGHFVCMETKLICSDGADSPMDAIELSRYDNLEDSNDETGRWVERRIVHEDDVDWFYIDHVEDTWTGLMQPEVWITGDKGSRLCMYILEDRRPDSVDYTCSGTGKRSDGPDMTVSANEPAELVLEDGRKFTGFCTKPSPDAYVKYLKFNNVEKALSDNSLTAYISVSLDEPKKNTCGSYALNYRF